jgi:hypothetical protein
MNHLMRSNTKAALLVFPLMAIGGCVSPSTLEEFPGAGDEPDANLRRSQLRCWYPLVCSLSPAHDPHNAVESQVPV